MSINLQQCLILCLQKTRKKLIAFSPPIKLPLMHGKLIAHLDAWDGFINSLHMIIS